MKKLLLTLSAGVMLTAATKTADAQVGIQIIHNCADTTARFVDLHIRDASTGGTLLNQQLLDNFEYLSATPFLTQIPGFGPIPANLGFIVDVKDSSGATTIQSFTFASGLPVGNHVIVASGVGAPANFATNPDSRSTALDLKVIQNAATAANGSDSVALNFIHGITDAPGVDVKIGRISSALTTIIADAKYGDVVAGANILAKGWITRVFPAGGSTPVMQKLALLQGAGGLSATVFATGFLNPATNNNGPAAKLYAALADGTVFEIEDQKFVGGVQIIHNSSDTLARLVDVWVNGVKFFPNFAYRACTPYLNILFAGLDYEIGIAPAGSASVNDTVKRFDVSFAQGQIAVAMVAGLITPSSYAANPDGENTGLKLIIEPAARTTSTGGATNTDLLVIHGSTDAPTVDLAAGPLTLVNDIKYGEVSSYLSVPSSNYVVDLKDAAGTTTIQSYQVDLTTSGGASLVAYASGFLTPANNLNGAGFQIWVATPGGQSFALPLAVSITDPTALDVTMRMFPNPSNGVLNMVFDVEQSKNISVDIVDVSGRVIKSVFNDVFAAGRHNMTADLTDVNNGIYFARVTTAAGVTNNKFVLVK